LANFSDEVTEGRSSVRVERGGLSYRKSPIHVFHTDIELSVICV